MTRLVSPVDTMSRRTRQLIVLALIVAYLLPLPYAAAHLDLARDMFVGWRIVTGEWYPAIGPIMASTLHLGPVWYYLLAAGLWTTGSWLGTVALLALLGALQMPAAYLAGKALHGRAVGLLWATLLLLPTWSTFEQILPTHTQLTATLCLAALAAMLRYYRTRRPKYLVATGLAFGLALHAHPTSVMLVIPGSVLLIWAWRVRAMSIPALVLAGLLALLPFTSFVVVQITSGFGDLRAAADYLGGSPSLGSIGATPAIFAAIVYGGPHYWFGTMLGWPAAGATTMAVWLAAIIGVGMLGCLREYRNPRLGPLAWIAPLVVLTSLLGIALIREPTPYYMTTVVRVMLAGVVAVGAIALARTQTMARSTPIIAASVIGAYLAVVVGIIRIQTQAAWPFSFVPLFEVKAAPAADAPTPLLAAYAMARSGAFLCGHTAVTAHGAYGSQLVHDYGLEGRMACSAMDVVIGGADASREHWLGLSRHVLRQAGLRPQDRIGPLGMFRVEQVFGRGVSYRLPSEPRYPPIPVSAAAPQVETYEVELRDGDWLAISNLAFVFSLDHEVSLSLDGRPLPIRAQDRISKLYSCDACANGKTVVAKLSVTNNDPDHVDIVRFQSP